MTDVKHLMQFTRCIPLSPQTIIDHDKRRLQISFSSQNPLQRQSALYAPWIEILGHDEDEIDLTRLNQGAAVLYNHDQKNIAHSLGIVEKAWLEDQRGQAIIRLSKRPEVDGLWQDIQEGIIKHVSVGYLIKQRRLIQRANGKEADIYRITQWQPREISLVTVPADISVGIGRSDNFNLNWSNATMENKMTVQEGSVTESEKTDQTTPTRCKAPDLEQENTTTQAPHTLEKRSQDRQVIQEEILQAESQRRQTIRNIFTPYATDKQTLYNRCLDDPNISVDFARQLLLDDI